MADPQPDVMDAAHQIFVLSFDLFDSEVERLPGQLAKTLVSPPVQDAIKKTLLDFAKTKAGTTTSVVTEEEAQKLAAALQGNVTSAAGDELLRQLKGTPEYKKLMTSLDAFKKAAETSSLGVWVDKNKNILYLVGAALVIGTGTVLYVTKTGGKLLDTALDPLKGKSFEVLHIGVLTLKAELWDFKPDARVLGAKVVTSLNWEKVKLDIKLGVLAQGAQVQEAQGEAVFKSGPVNLTLTSDVKPQTRVVNLGLKVGYTAGNFNLGVGAMYNDQQLSGTASASYKTNSAVFGLQGNIGPQKTGGTQYGAMFTITIPVH